MKVDERCFVPLTTNELGSFEITPDGLIYLDEISEDDLTCLAERYLRTKDSGTRSAYRGALKNGPWEKVRDHLLSMGEDVPADLKNMRRHILDNEFVEKDILTRIQFQTEGYRSGMTQKEGESLTEQNQVSFSPALSSSINGLLIFSGTKLKLNISPEIKLAMAEMNIALPDGPVSESGNVIGLNLSGGAEYFARDDSWRIGAEGFHKQSLGQILSDTEKNSSYAGASTEVRDILGTELVAGAAGSFNRTEYAPAINPDFNDRGSRQLSGSAQFGYQDGSAGLGGLLKLSGNLTDNTDYFRSTDKKSFSTSLLGQLRLNSDDTLRIGGGGGLWNEEFERKDSGEGGESSGSEIHVSAETGLKFDTTFELSAAALFQFNRSEGTFNGWFPSWNASVTGTLNLDDNNWKLSLGLAHSGKDVDLDITQRERYLSIGPAITYLPIDHLRIGLSGSFNYNDTRFFEAYRQLNGWGKLQASYEIGNCAVFAYAYTKAVDFKNTASVAYNYIGGGSGIECRY